VRLSHLEVPSSTKPAYDDSIFVVLKTAWYKEEVEEIELGEILLFIGDGFVVTVRHGPASGLTEVRKRLEKSPDLLKMGPGAVLYAILDRVVDDYRPVVLASKTTSPRSRRRSSRTPARAMPSGSTS